METTIQTDVLVIGGGGAGLCSALAAAEAGAAVTLVSKPGGNCTAIAAGGFQEFNLFNMADRAMEYEANMFAAQVALPDEEILEYIMRGCDVAQIAQLMHSDINLVALKTAELNRQGRRFRQPEHRCDFLK